MKMKLILGAIGLILIVGNVHGSSNVFREGVTTPPTVSNNAGEHNDRRNCQLAMRRGQELPQYCSRY